MFVASPSKLKLYQTCPQQYKFCYLDKLKEAYRTHQPYLTMGENVHNAINHFYKKIKASERNLEKLKNVLREKWKTNRKPFKPGSEEEKRYGEKALKQLENFYQSLGAREPFLIPEKFFSVELDSDLKLTGKIDRVDEEDGALHIIDYKTGKRENNPDYGQLSFYALLVARKLKREVAKVSYFYLGKNDFVSQEVDKDLLDWTLIEIQKTVVQILADQKFLPQPGPLCRYCDFVEICPQKEKVLAQGLVTKIKREEPF